MPVRAVRTGVEFRVVRSENGPVLLDTRCPEADDDEVLTLLGTAVDACGAAWAELRLGVDGADASRTYRKGRRAGDGIPVELPVGAGYTATLLLGADRPPETPIVRLIALGLSRVLLARRYLEQASLLRSALDTTASAVLLFDSSGAIAYANPAGDELLARQTESELRVVRGDRRPAPLISDVCGRAERLAAAPAAASQRELLSLTDGSTMLCELLRVRIGAGSDATGVLVFLQRVGAGPRLELEAFSDSHGLSPREMEVAHLLLDGCTTAAIADRLGISSHTVRDHLKHVYRKTDTRSRGELISRLAGAAPAAGAAERS